MKLKEYWPSYRTARKLKKFTPAQLNASEAPEIPVIVTLTSIPSRLATLHLTIRSLMRQSVKPEKIVLWLHHDLEKKLPLSLSELQGTLFEIRYVNLTCSHRKLIHALDAYPKKTLVTSDDDLLYNPSWLERLYETHLAYPRDIIAHECRRIRHDATGAPLPYKQWPTLKDETDTASHDLMAIGYGGVLYPPEALLPEVTNQALFLSLTPKADDLWFKMMAYLKGTKIRRSQSPGPKPIPIIASQKVSLMKTNVREDGNRLQWLALRNHYNVTDI